MLFRSFLLLGAAAVCATPALAQEAVESITVTAAKLAEARNGIQTQTGASTFTVTAKDIQAQPGGDNSALNSVVLQMPGVAQDSFGQLHIRGEHNGLQYRLNGIILARSGRFGPNFPGDELFANYTVNALNYRVFRGDRICHQFPGVTPQICGTVR